MLIDGIQNVTGADPLASLLATWRQEVSAPPLMSVSEWADKYRFLPAKSSPAPGRWRTARTPYLREIMDCLSVTSPIRRVVFMKGAQIGGSECGNNWLGYIMAAAPGPSMFVAPTESMVKRQAHQRLDPMITSCPDLREKVVQKKGRESGNTMFYKEFPGGMLILTWAGSATGLRSASVRNIFMDEVDAYEADVDGEGSPIMLAERRAATFGTDSKLLIVSTPKHAGSSIIALEYEGTDKRRFHVMCPGCQARAVIDMEQIERRGETVGRVCPRCGAFNLEHEKDFMLENGVWVPQRHDAPKSSAGFHLSSLYSPAGWFSWGDCLLSLERAGKDPASLPTHVNTVEGLPFEAGSEAPPWEALYELREDYNPGIVPAGAVFLTAGADVQKNRIEVEVVAHGPGRETWSIDYLVLDGDVTQPGPWDALEKVLSREYPCQDGGALKIRVMAVDSGYASSEVYQWVRRHPQPHHGPNGSAANIPGTVVAVKGRDAAGKTAVLSVSQMDATETKKRGVRIWTVNSSALKSLVYRLLSITIESDGEEQAGRCHFPQYDEHYFQMLTAERVETVFAQGQYRERWVKPESTSIRNEALDCRVYAMAAASIFGVDRFRESDWERLDGARKTAQNVKKQPKKAEEKADVAGSWRNPSRIPRRRGLGV